MLEALFLKDKGRTPGTGCYWRKYKIKITILLQITTQDQILWDDFWAFLKTRIGPHFLFPTCSKNI